MAYTKQTWSDSTSGFTQITADRLNHMEEGIASIHEAWDSANSSGKFTIRCREGLQSSYRTATITPNSGVSRQAFLVFGSQNNGMPFLLVLNIVRMSKTAWIETVVGSYTFSLTYNEDTDTADLTSSDITYSHWAILSCLDFKVSWN